MLVAHARRPGCCSFCRAIELPHHELSRGDLKDGAKGGGQPRLQLIQTQETICQIHRLQPACRRYRFVRWNLFRGYLHGRLGSRKLPEHTEITGRKREKKKQGKGEINKMAKLL